MSSAFLPMTSVVPRLRLENAIEMIVVGGCYRELCESPHWDRVLGSGGRAAVVLGALEPNVTLQTYRPKTLSADLYPIEVSGVRVSVQSSATEIVFSYLHPLSSPVVWPKDIRQEEPLRVTGESVVRFGMME